MVCEMNSEMRLLRTKIINVRGNYSFDKDYKVRVINLLQDRFFEAKKKYHLSLNK